MLSRTCRSRLPLTYLACVYTVISCDYLRVLLPPTSTIAACYPVRHLPEHRVLCPLDEYVRSQKLHCCVL